MNWLKRKVLLVAVISLLVPLAAQAIDGGSALWIDKENIRYPNNGASATDGDAYVRNGGNNFFRQGDLKNLCSDDNASASNNANTYAKFYENGTQIHVITDFSSDNSHAIYRVLGIKLYDRSVDGRYTEVPANKTKISNGKIAMVDSQDFAFYGCKKAQEDSKIVLQQAQHASEDFHWLNKTQIESSDTNNRVYTKDDGSKFVWQGDPNSCDEFLDVAPLSSSGTLNYQGAQNGAGVCTWKTRPISISLVEHASDSPDPTNPIGSTDDSPGGGGTGDPCHKIGGFAYVFCPILRGADDLIAKAFAPGGIVSKELATSPLDSSTTGGATLKKVWEAMRNLTNIFFVLIFLVIVFANIASINIDAYTVKKALPRLVAAVLLVQFSFVICSFIIDLGNILGAGIPGLLTVSGVGGATNSTETIVAGISGAVFLGGAAAFVTALGAWLLFVPMLISLVFSILILIFTLAVRHFAINVLVVLSPLAFAAWILPNTEKFFKMWWKDFTRIILMYPFIILLMAIAVVMSKFGGIIGQLAPIVVLGAVPATFKAASVLLEAATGAATKRASGAHDSLQGKIKKDARAGMQERNYLKSQNADSRAIGRFMGRVGTGNVMPGRSSQRRLQAGYAGAVRARGDEYENQFVNDKYSSNELASIASGKTGQTVRGVKIDDAAKVKAIEMLARKGEYKKLNQIRQGMLNSAGEMDTGQNRVWQAGIQKNIGDVFSKAPDLVAGDSAFDNLSAEKIAGFDASTADRLVKYLGTPKGAAARVTTMSAIHQLANAPALRSKVDQRVVGVLASNASIFNSVNVDDGGTTKNGEKFLADRTSNLVSQTDPATGEVTVRGVLT